MDQKRIIQIINEEVSSFTEDFNTPHKIISPNKMYSENKNEIDQFLTYLAKKYHVGIDDIAISLSKSLQRV